MQTDFTSLIGSTQQTPEQTLAAKREAFAAQFRAAIANQFNGRVQAYKDLYAAIWGNNGLSPKQSILALGTDAKKVFEMSAIEAAYLNGFKPGVVNGDIPEGFTITFKEDGSLLDLTEAA